MGVVRARAVGAQPRPAPRRGRRAARPARRGLDSAREAPRLRAARRVRRRGVARVGAVRAGRGSRAVVHDRRRRGGRHAPAARDRGRPRARRVVAVVAGGDGYEALGAGAPGAAAGSRVGASRREGAVRAPAAATTHRAGVDRARARVAASAAATRRRAGEVLVQARVAAPAVESRRRVDVDLVPAVRRVRGRRALVARPGADRGARLVRAPVPVVRPGADADGGPVRTLMAARLRR